jgi:hypothetical protein
MSEDVSLVCPQCGAIPSDDGDGSSPAERFLKHAEKVHGLSLDEAKRLSRNREPRTEIEIPAFDPADNPPPRSKR